MRLRTGRRITVRAIADQKRPSRPAESTTRPRTGTRRAFTLSAQETQQGGHQRERGDDRGEPDGERANSQAQQHGVRDEQEPGHRENESRRPLKTTARLAVAPEAAMASRGSRPKARSSR